MLSPYLKKTDTTSLSNRINIKRDTADVIPILKGGTGATTAAAARTNLGLVIGTDVLAPNGSAANLTNFPTLDQNTTGTAANVTGTVAIANGGTGATDAATARTNLVAQETLVSGTNIKTVGGQSLLGSGNILVGSGTVTSVSGTGTVQGITLSGTVTSSGNLTLGGSLSAINLANQVSGTLPIGNGGTGVTTGPMGVLLQTISASTTTNITFPGGYTNYLITGTGFIASTTTLFLTRFFYSGVLRTTNYNNFWVGSSFGTAYTLNFNNESFGRLLQQDASNGMIDTSIATGTGFYLYFYNVGANTEGMMLGQYIGKGGGMNGGTICTGQGVTTGVQFALNSGTMSAGTFKLYGLL